MCFSVCFDVSLFSDSLTLQNSMGFSSHCVFFRIQRSGWAARFRQDSQILNLTRSSGASTGTRWELQWDLWYWCSFSLGSLVHDHYFTGRQKLHEDEWHCVTVNASVWWWTSVCGEHWCVMANIGAWQWISVCDSEHQFLIVNAAVWR